jgi:alpha-galactosidase
MILKRGGRMIALISALPFAALHISNTSAAVPDHSQIVLPAEMNDAKHWLDERLAVLERDGPAQEQTIVRGIAQGWGTFHRGWSVNHNPLKLNGKTFETGFGSHADAIVELSLPPNQKLFTATCGIDDTDDARKAANSAIFTVEADGHEVFRSKPIVASDPPLDLKIDLKGVKRLTLKAIATGDQTYMPIDWANVQITSDSGDVQTLGQREFFTDGKGGAFSFVDDGVSSDAIISSWKRTTESLTDEPDRTGQRITWTDPATGLQCITEIKRYTHYPVVEWVQRFKNTGSKPTPILEKIRSMDLLFPADDKLLLHHNTGDYAAADSYQPFTTELTSKETFHFEPDGGRPTNKGWPYFNIEEPLAHRGTIAVVGWPGQWCADISRDQNGDGLRITAGQEFTHFRLLPGEEMRTPLSVLMFYRGDVVRSQNLWRRWMLDCNVPRPDGQLPPAIHSASLGLHQSEKTETDGINLFMKERAGLTHWWMDAGWYPCKEGDGGWWPGVGTWEPDQTRFPRGIRPVSDLAHADGLKTILWFEPERAHAGSWLVTHHPDWLLQSEGSPDEHLLDLGNPDAWAWLVDHVDHMLVSQGIDLYRQDFNFDPLPYWRAHDAPDRIGMTEIKHVEGYLNFWDELHRRHPNLLIDTCASGGRRLDLETLRRSVSLWPSDDSTIPEDNQSHAFGIASWIPYFGSGVGCDTPYAIRSAMFPFFGFGMPTDPKAPMDWNLYRRESANWSLIRENQIGDYYPLTPYSLDHTAWIAWQFDRPDLGTGVIQAFRRPDSPFTAATFPLSGIDPEASYLVTNLDEPSAAITIKGDQLIAPGLAITLSARPSAGIVTYAKVK